jgi:hypothetical protein
LYVAPEVRLSIFFEVDAVVVEVHCDAVDNLYSTTYDVALAIADQDGVMDETSLVVETTGVASFVFVVHCTEEDASESS